MCTNYWLAACSSLPRKKVWFGELAVPHNHNCCLGRKTTKQTNKSHGAENFFAIPRSFVINSPSSTILSVKL